MYIINEVVIVFNEITISMIVMARPDTLYLLVSHLSEELAFWTFYTSLSQTHL